jgi:hypothetical protein
MDDEEKYEVKISVRYIEEWKDIIKMKSLEELNSEFVFGINDPEPVCIGLRGYDSKTDSLIGIKQLKEDIAETVTIPCTDVLPWSMSHIQVDYFGLIKPFKPDVKVDKWTKRDIDPNNLYQISCPN